MDTPRSPGNLAPGWHTALLVALIVTVALTGLLLAQGTTATPAQLAPALPPAHSPWGRILSVYAPFLVVNAGLLVYVCRVARPASALRSLFGAWPRGASAVARDLALALLAAAVIEAGEAWWLRGHAGSTAAAAALAPSTSIERAAWVAFALTAAFSEEVIYRGYLQTQLSAFTRSATLGIAFQAALFGLAHSDQGLAAGGRFAVYALGLGLLARLRGGLLPGVLAHGLVDLFSGLAR